MKSGLYTRFKQFLPSPVRRMLSFFNQTFFARSTLRRKYGDWFEIDWRKKFKTMTDGEWKRAYDEAWRNRRNDCVAEGDAELFLNAIQPPGSVAEVGCGQGQLAIRLAREGFRVTGIDVSPEALSLARDNGQKSGMAMEWVEGFAEHLPFPDKAFDYLTCAHTLEHVKDLHAATNEFKRVTRKAILVLTPKQEFKLYMDNYHTQFFDTKEKLVDAFGLKHWKCMEVEGGDSSGDFQGQAWFYVGYLQNDDAHA